MISFRVDENEAAAAQRWADQPLTEDEAAIGQIAEWQHGEVWFAAAPLLSG